MIFSNHNVHGPDVSFHQDDDSTPQQIDFLQMRFAGADFVIIRAGQRDYADSDFAANWRAARDVGLPRGSYWFYDSRADPSLQAVLWKSLIGSDLPELGLWLDLEEAYGGAWRGEWNWRLFLEELKLLFPGVKIGIYTANWWWQAQTISDYEYFGGYPLWVAQYTADPSVVIVPRGWTDADVKFWQYTSHGDGLRYGAESLDLDLNLFNGDLDAFRNYFHLGGGTVPPNGGSMSKFYRWNSVAANIRIGPGASYLDKGDLRNGDVIQVDEAKSGSWFPYKLAQHSDGSWVTLANGTPLDLLNTTKYWSTDSYFVEVSGLPNPPIVTPPPPPSDDFDYIVGHRPDGTTKKYIPE